MPLMSLNLPSRASSVSFIRTDRVVGAAAGGLAVEEEEGGGSRVGSTHHRQKADSTAACGIPPGNRSRLNRDRYHRLHSTHSNDNRSSH
ncbi:unnamed protein product [Danaus chrysippus]|uniref:(African queen) hypothetical protein n=1 Tax=Danaus chrysippus TaxID=151541 RepID=A0A8J2R5A9_9NEOP|nr:unnamed protein product [Danaus chrysippus]